VEDGLLDVLTTEGIGCIAFSPLAQGILTNKYLGGIPDGSRGHTYKDALHWGDKVSAERIAKVEKLNEIAADRGQTMAQMAVAWVLRQPALTSALIGASKVSQVEDIVGALTNLDFSDDELAAIEKILAG
jgi:L-glyceraldehyde 3-phosphate reductase